MCTRTVIEHRCKHRVGRGSTRCYRQDCPGRTEEVLYDADVCPQCEASKGVRSARWCPVGCARCVVM